MISHIAVDSKHDRFVGKLKLITPIELVVLVVVSSVIPATMEMIVLPSSILSHCFA